MNFRQEYEAYFGTDKLARYDETVIANLKIPSDAKLFLIDVGLPRTYHSGGSFVYNVLPEIPLLGAAFADVYFLPQEYHGFRAFCTLAFEDIGIGCGEVICFYCLDEQANGQVIELTRPFGDKWAAILLNSSIPQFAEFLFIVDQFRQWLRQRAVERDRSGRPFRCSEVDLRFRLVMRKLKQLDRDAITSLSHEVDFPSWESILQTMINHCGCG